MDWSYTDARQQTPWLDAETTVYRWDHDKKIRSGQKFIPDQMVYIDKHLLAAISVCHAKRLVNTSSIK